MVRRLTAKEILELANNFALSNHARQRLEQRMKFGTNVDEIKKSILNTALAFYDSDGCITIQAYDMKEHYVFVKKDNCYLMITCKEPSNSNTDLFTKFFFASCKYRCDRPIRK